MTELSQRTLDVATRTQRMARLVTSIERLLLAEQAEAISAPAENVNAPREPRDRYNRHGEPIDPYEPTTSDEVSVDVGHSDPTPRMASRLAGFRRHAQSLASGLHGVEEALDALERRCTAAISVKPSTVHTEDDNMCPGWSDDLRARLGGCGQVRSTYVRSDKTVGTRALCDRCRTAKSRAHGEVT